MNEIINLLEMRNISKTLCEKKVLDNIDFILKKGEIHAVIEEAEDGKTALMNMLNGIDFTDSGIINIEGNEVNIKNLKHAMSLGISTVFKDNKLCENLSVAENVYLGREPRTMGLIDKAKMNKKTRVMLQKLSLEIDASKTIDNYSESIKQMIAIARAIETKPKILILDKPTESLDSVQTDRLFNVMKLLKSQGVGIIFLENNLEEAYRISDTITVFTDGKHETFDTKEVDKSLIESKFKKDNLNELDSLFKIRKEKEDEKENFIKIEDLKGKNGIMPFDLEINKGEIIGFAGLKGSGKTEVAKLLAGADKVKSGNIFINDTKVIIKKPLDALKNNINYLEENTENMIIPHISIRENIILAIQSKKGVFNRISRKKALEIADKYIEEWKIKAYSGNESVDDLDVIDKQKVVLARLLESNPELLILDEPLKGADTESKDILQKKIARLADEGKTIILISLDTDIMIRCCDRMSVMRNFQKIGELEGEISKEVLISTIAGGAK